MIARRHRVTCRATGLFIIVGLSVLASRPAWSGDDDWAGRRYAVIIGNNLGRSGEGELLYAEKDAQTFAEVMTKLGGLPADDLVLMLGDSRDEIRRALLHVNARIREENDIVPGPSTLVVYYSGHADVAGLHPGNATLPYEELRAMLHASAATVRILILDGCRSGEITSVKGARQTAEFTIRTSVESAVEGVVMISSSAAGEDSHESARLRASFFSHHLANALRGAADDDGNRMVTLSEAYAYAYRNTLRSSGRTNQLQHPTYSYDLKGKADYPMTRLAPSRASAELRLDGRGVYLVYRGKHGGEVVAELNVLSERARLALPPERYFVQKRASDHYLEYDVKLSAGVSLDLADTKHRKISYARLVRKGSEQKWASHQLHAAIGGRGAVLDGLGPSAALVVGYQLDLPAVSLAVRARHGRSVKVALSDALDARHQEWAAGVVGLRFFDFSALSVGVGLIGELIVHRQTFTGPARAEDRSVFGISFGGLLTLQRQLKRQTIVSIEGGPITYHFRRARVEAGVEIGDETDTRLTGWLAAGLGWQF